MLVVAGDKDAKFKRELGKQVVLGAGFGIGVNGKKFQMTCKKYGMDIPIELAQKAVRAYRNTHRAIPAYWPKIEQAALLAFANPTKSYRIGKLKWKMEKNFLTVELPIGRKLYYFDPKVTRKRTFFGTRPELSYMGIDSKSKKFFRTSTWGGKLTENVVQAIARDLLQEATLRLEQTPSKPVLTVHDEVIAERPDGQGSLQEFLRVMSIVPTWAEGLPVKVEGWSEKRYRK